MDMRHRVYYAVNLSQNHCRWWWMSGYDNYGIVYDSNLRKLKGAVKSLKIRPLRREHSPDRYFQQMISCKWEEEVVLVAMLGELKWVNYEKLDGKDVI